MKREEMIKLINDFINTPMGTNVGVFVDEFLASHPEPQPQEAEKEVSDEDIERYFTSQHYDNKNGNHYRINKDRIFGAKAMRDNLIKKG